MDDRNCVAFLQWALPRMGMRWSGFRKVRRRVCKRVERRRRELGLADVIDYRAHLETHPEEWRNLDAMCAVVISRFYRDHGVFDALAGEVLPALAERAADRLICWSVGCASGEEAYTLKMLFDRRCRPSYPDVELRVLGTDIDETVLERARLGMYGESSVREVRMPVRAEVFERVNAEYRVRDEHRVGVEFTCMDVRTTWPDGPFDLILCRNSAFTYFAADVQAAVLDRLVDRVIPGGALVIGCHESLPAKRGRLEPWIPRANVFRRRQE